jgi:hypothetical protein
VVEGVRSEYVSKNWRLRWKRVGWEDVRNREDDFDDNVWKVVKGGRG